MRLVPYLAIVISCLARLCLAQDSPGSAAAAAPHLTVLRARALIDGTSGQARLKPEILVRGNRIAEVTTAGAHPPPPGAEVMDLGGATLIPVLMIWQIYSLHHGSAPA